MAGIAEQLRQAVLQAAIQGKLTEQLPEDGDARDLLAEIQAEKAKLIAEKKIKKEKPLEPISKEEMAFVVPTDWAIARLGDIGIYKKGPFGSALTKSIFVPKSVNTIKVYEQKNAIKKDASLGNYYITEEYFLSKMKGFEVFPGDIIVSCAGTIGEAYVLPDEMERGIINQALMRIKLSNRIDKNYFLLFFDYFLKASAKENSKGSAIKNIPPFDILKGYVIPIPPLAEQHRIVAHVDELMAKIDELEKVENELNALHKAFPGDMKAALLQAAMQGKLTEQLPEDGNAEDLLKSIEAEKGKPIAEKKIKKQKALEPIADDEIPFEIPDNWKWNRLRNLVYNRGQKTPVKEFSYIDIGSIDNIHQRLNDNETIIPAAEAPSRARKIVGLGDILYSTVRPYLHNACIIDKNFRAEPIASTGFAVLTCYKGVNSKYLLYYMLSPAFDQYANATDNAKGVAYPAINDEKLYKAVVPLPPLAEQQRIVEKLDKLLPLCDSLEEKL